MSWAPPSPVRKASRNSRMVRSLISTATSRPSKLRAPIPGPALKRFFRTLSETVGCQAAHALSAIGFRQLGGNKAKLAHFPHQRAVQHPGVVALQKAGSNAISGKAPGMLANCLQVFVDVGIHSAVFLIWCVSSGCSRPARTGSTHAGRHSCRKERRGGRLTWRTCGTRACAFPSAHSRLHATLRCRSTA